jgi:hypothetical protein
MSRFFFFIIVSLFSLTVFVPTFAACDPISGGSAKDFLSGCAQDSADGNRAVVVPPSGWEEGVKELVVKIATRVLQFGALFAIGAIVWSGIRYTTSAGDDEKTKSAKNVLIYAIIGLLLLLTAFPLVDIIVRFIYSLGN